MSSILCPIQGPFNDSTIPFPGKSNLARLYDDEAFTQQVTEVLSEVSVLKDRQEDTDAKLENMKMENEALWQEVPLDVSFCFSWNGRGGSGTDA